MADDLVEPPLHERAKHLARVSDAPRLVLAHDEVALRIGELGRADKRLLKRPNSIVARFQQRFEFGKPLRQRVRTAMAQRQRRQRDDEQAREHAGKTDIAAFHGIERPFLRAGVAAELQQGHGEAKEQEREASRQGPHGRYSRPQSA